MPIGWHVGSLVLVLSVWTAAAPARIGLQTASKPRFKTGVDHVALFAVARDRHDRLVTNLSKADFELLDAGEPRRILEFGSDPTPVSLAFLLDVSGSMAIGGRLDRAELAAQQVLNWLEPGKDEAAMFAFDTELRELKPFSTAVDQMQSSFEGAQMFGATSLWDAIAAAAYEVVQRGGQRRALVALTDGVDTHSRSSAREASEIARSVDVPVHIIATDPPRSEATMGDLADLARGTGGELHVVTSAATASIAAREIVDELRHAYLIVFETDAHPGWHPLVVRTRDRTLSVQARSGYFVEP